MDSRGFNMKITWYGTASVSIETAEASVLFDPFLPLPGSRVAVSKKDFSRFQNIVITHGHVDHISSLPTLCRETDRQIYASVTPCKTLKRMGIDEKNLHEIGAGTKLSFGDIRITAYHAKHIRFDLPLIVDTVFDRRNMIYRKNVPELYTGFLSYPEHGEILTYLIEAEGKRIFLMGSLGLDPEESYPADLDVLILPYQGRKDLFRPAVTILKTLRPERVILDHFDDTFPPMSRDIDTGRIERVKLFSAKGKMKIIRPVHKKCIEI